VRNGILPGRAQINDNQVEVALAGTEPLRADQVAKELASQGGDGAGLDT
jgi:hypothetical protein